MRKASAALVTLSFLAGCSEGGFAVSGTPAPVLAGASAATAEPAALVLPLEVDQQVAETFVRIGFGLNPEQRFQSTEFLTPRLRTAQAAPLIRMVKRYNEFNGEQVAAAVEKLRGRVSAVEFGREGSPVIYIELPYWTHQREEAPPGLAGSKIGDPDNEKFVEELRRVFVGELKADEFTQNRRRVRIWWD